MHMTITVQHCSCSLDGSVVHVHCLAPGWHRCLAESVRRTRSATLQCTSSSAFLLRSVTIRVGHQRSTFPLLSSYCSREILSPALRMSRLSFTLAASLCSMPTACGCVSRLARRVSQSRMRLRRYSDSRVHDCRRHKHCHCKVYHWRVCSSI